MSPDKPSSRRGFEVSSSDGHVGRFLKTGALAPVGSTIQSSASVGSWEKAMVVWV